MPFTCSTARRFPAKYPYKTGTLLVGPRETFVLVNASSSLSCLFLFDSRNASAIVQWRLGNEEFAVRDNVNEHPKIASCLPYSLTYVTLNGKHSLLNYSMLVESALCTTTISDAVQAPTRTPTRFITSSFFILCSYAPMYSYCTKYLYKDSYTGLVTCFSLTSYYSSRACEAHTLLSLQLAPE